MASRDTVINVMKLLNTQYIINKSQDSLVDLWSTYFSEVPDELLESAVYRFIAKDNSRDRYFPKIGTIRAEIAVMIREKHPSGNEIWPEIRKAIGKAASESVKAFQSLPDILQQAVGSPGILREYVSDYTSDYDRSKIKQGILEHYEQLIDAKTDFFFPMKNPLPRISYTAPVPPKMILPEPENPPVDESVLDCLPPEMLRLMEMPAGLRHEAEI